MSNPAILSTLGDEVVSHCYKSVYKFVCSSQHLWCFTSQNPPVVVLNPECDELDLISSNTHLMHSEVRSNEKYKF